MKKIDCHNTFKLKRSLHSVSGVPARGAGDGRRCGCLSWKKNQEEPQSPRGNTNCEPKTLEYWLVVSN